MHLALSRVSLESLGTSIRTLPTVLSPPLAVPREGVYILTV